MLRCRTCRELWQRFASQPIRSTGTLGGSVANGSPIGDSAPWLIVLGAEIVLRSGKGQRKSLPPWLSDDSDPGDLTAMRDHKIEIIPIRATFPTLKVFKNGQQTRFRSGFDLARDCPLLCVKFGLFQSAADA